MLHRIEAANLFIIALDEEGTWSRYHHLFRDFLRTWLKRTQPERAATLHRLACGWFAEHGSLREAAYHAFQCGDWSFAADFVENHCFTLIIQSEIATIYEWTVAIPETVMQNRPMLCIFQALALAYHFHWKNRVRVEVRLKQAERKLTETPDSQQSGEANDLATIVLTFQAMTPDPTADAQKHLDLALSHLIAYPENDPGRFPWLLITGYCLLALHQTNEAEKAFSDALPFALHAGLLFGVVETIFHLARLAHSRGRLSEAVQICQNGQETLSIVLRETNQALPALGCLDIVIGDILLEQNHLEEAETCLQKGMERMGWGMNPYYLMNGWLAQFRLFQAQGRLEKAMTCLDQLDLLWPDLLFFTEGLRAQTLLRFRPGETTQQTIRDWLQSYLSIVGGALPIPGLGPIGAAEVYYQANLIWAKLQIAIGNPQSALPYITKQLTLACGQKLLEREIELSLLEAQAYDKQNNPAQALESLAKALDAGRSAGYVRIFDQCETLDSLIHEAVRQGVCIAHAERVLAAIRSAKRSGRTSDTDISIHYHQPGEIQLLSGKSFIEEISDRELDVLRLMASGSTNQQIAAQLVITVGTVKSHINHILGKLNASNRTEAVVKARQNGLIE